MSDEWKRGEQDSLGLQCEWGSSGTVRFPIAGQVSMCDSEGKTILCACGKPAGAGIMGKEAYLAFCGECYHKYLKETEASFSYKPPVEQNIHNQILTDSWVVNMREGIENGDTDWYDPTTMPPVDGEPVYLKLNLIVKAKYTPNGSATWELVQDLNEAKGEILSWQKRED